MDENDRRIFFYYARVLFHFIMIYCIKTNTETSELNMHTIRNETRTVVNSSFMKLSKQTSCGIANKWESESLFIYENQVLPTENKPIQFLCEYCNDNIINCIQSTQTMMSLIRQFMII